MAMPERLTRADEDRIATLARLELTDAEKVLRQLLAAEPNNARVMNHLGYLLASRGIVPNTSIGSRFIQ